jgi:hypothetical protein
MTKGPRNIYAADISTGTLDCQTGTLDRPSKSERVDRFPIIVAEWPRSTGEIVRITLGRYRNRFTIDIRSWWQNSDSIFKPSLSGLTLDIKHLQKLAEGLDRALMRADLLGLVEHVSRTKDRTAAERQRRYRQRRIGVTAR